MEITLKNYLSNSHPIKEDNYYRVHSCLTMALRESRIITGRSELTGRVIRKFKGKPKTGYPGHLLGTVGYLLILDQIGSCFRPIGASRTASNTKILKALEFFAPSLTEPERYALYALRCSLAHNFNLINISKRRDPRLKQLLSHKFQLTIQKNYALITLPAIPWNMMVGTEDNNQQTIINVRRVGDLVEQIVKNLRKEERKNNIEISLPNEISDLQKMYLTWVKKSDIRK